jgi:predicted nucleotidyltransferase component of viral defense system
MATIREMLRRANEDGYNDENAEAKVCQDVIIKALSQSSLSRNATIKGGVVMRSISGDARRATQDMDIDFIRYSLDNESIRLFIHKLNCLDGITSEQTGGRTELKQQDYHGKRVFSDNFYKRSLAETDKKWVDEPVDKILGDITDFLESI